MTSPITHMVGSASAQVAQNTSVQPSSRNSVPGQLSQSQTIAASQASAERATAGRKINEKDRAVQVPKRTEGTFDARAVRPKKEKTDQQGADEGAEQETSPGSSSHDGKLDVVA